MRGDEPIQQPHLRVLETFAVQDDFRDERVVRDHHCHRAKAGLVREEDMGIREDGQAFLRAIPVFFFYLVQKIEQCLYSLQEVSPAAPAFHHAW